MRSPLPWRGVRLGTNEIGADPDAPTRRVAIPSSWGETAAAGFVGLLGPTLSRSWDPVRLPEAAERWIAPLDAAARDSRASAGLGAALHGLLFARQAAPDAWAWRDAPEGVDATGRFAIHLAAFADEADGLDTAALDAATESVTLALSLAARDRAPRSLRLTGLDGLLAILGLAYDSGAGRDIAADIVRRVRCAARAVDPRVGLSGRVADPAFADALLGADALGIGPEFAPVDGAGQLTASSEARLAARGLSAERALALALAGTPPLASAGPAAAALMIEALAPLLDDLPVPLRGDLRAPLRGDLRAPLRGDPPARRPVAVPNDGPRPAATCRRLPSRAKGFTQKVTIGGHRVFLQTREYPDGSLGEFALAAGGREGGTARAAIEAVAAAISIGLQHGVPLAAFVDAFAHASFGASGAVEGDPTIATASSPLDFAMRALSAAYGGRHVDDPDLARAERAEDGDPLLPFGPRAGTEDDQETGRRQRILRLVSAS